jgi:endogenous inhibitor of DNA gyrase (YacG/DUF329 family)
MKQADVWREVIWECPHCEEHHELDVSENMQIHKRVEKCPTCGKESELDDS